MIRELILFRPFFSLLLPLSFSPFCTYEPTSQIHPSISMADWQVGKDADISKDGVVVGIAVTLHYDAAEFN